MSGLKVLVAGASIAGPMTAYWLAKAGAKVTVIERFAALRVGGQAVDIRTAGVSVMRKIAGMEARVREKSAQEEGIALVREDGRPYGTIRATGNPDQQTIVSEFEIFRGDLSRILFELTTEDENVEYVFGEQIASMRQHESNDGPVAVEFANGMQSAEYDLVVACDGATSRTRALGLDCGVRDHVIPTHSWSAYFSVPTDFAQGSTVTRGHSSVGGRFISVGADSNGLNRVMLTAVFPRDRPDATLPFREASQQGEDALKQYVASHFHGTGWITDAVLRDMMDSSDFYASETVQVKLPSIYRGRFVLVGDAGYAAGPTGGGTSLALAGAYIFAGEISRHPGDLNAALNAYAERMRPLIQEFQKIPPLVSKLLAPQTAWGIGIRNRVFALIAATGVVQFAGKYAGAAFARSEDFPLPTYDWGA